MDCICLAPPLMIGDDLIDRLVDIIRETIPAVLSSPDVQNSHGRRPISV
jgi:hypothetical protein